MIQNKPLKILAIEDDEFMKIFLKDVFWIHDGKSSELKVVGDLKKAKEILESGAGKPDLILLDLRLPEVAGGPADMEGTFNFLQNLKTDPKTKDIKIIVFSSFGDKELKDRAEKLGVDKFLVKGEYLPQEIIKISREVVGSG